MEKFRILGWPFDRVFQTGRTPQAMSQNPASTFLAIQTDFCLNGITLIQYRDTLILILMFLFLLNNIEPPWYLESPR